MKVYIVTKEPFPNGMAATNRIKCYAKAIISQGIECEVLIYCRTESHAHINNPNANGVFETIPFKYVGGKSVRRKNKLLNKTNTLFDRFRIITFLKKHLKDGDVVIGYGNQELVFSNYLIRIIHSRKAKYVRELCELPLGTGNETMSVLRKRSLLYKFQFPICDGFIAISDALVNIAKKYKSLNAKIVKIPILVDFEKYELPDKSQYIPVPYIFHSGTLTEQKDGILGMIEAFGVAQKDLIKPVRLVFTGNKEKSPCKKEIDELIDKYKLQDKVVFTGYLSDEDLRVYLQKASLVIINKAENQQNKYCFSTKLGEYMAAGKSIIITRVGEAMNWLTSGTDVLTVEPSNTQQLAEAVVVLFNNSDLRTKLGKAARITCKNCFDYTQWGTNIIDYFKEI